MKGKLKDRAREQKMSKIIWKKRKEAFGNGKPHRNSREEKQASRGKREIRNSHAIYF